MLILGLGLTGEAGEVAELLKKGLGHDHGIDREKLKKELGDVLWYVAVLAWYNDTTLAEVMQQNIDKLLARYPRGFTVEESKHHG
jgi:NTP pyrophosphatase (non-canonical NTP hydrolase)